MNGVRGILKAPVSYTSKHETRTNVREILGKTQSLALAEDPATE